MAELTSSADKVTENFTGKEHDDETELNYFGARYLDPMLGMWISVDPKRQFASPYLYTGNGVNPINGVDSDGNYTLNLNEDNTVAGMVDDDKVNIVSVFNADGSLFGEFNAPPAESYFSTENIIGQKFDPNMEKNADELLDDAYSIWPADFPFWNSKQAFDFKNTYYKGAENTVGSLNGTIMTARDVGNAIWGGWTRYMYLCPRPLMNAISNAVAGGKEDAPSAVMQKWGYDNYKP
jgi:RHS repeat-associated protein